MFLLALDASFKLLNFGRDSDNGEDLSVGNAPPQDGYVHTLGNRPQK